MSKELHSNVIAGFNLKPAMIAPSYVDFLSQTLENLKVTNLGEEKKSIQTYQVDTLASYGVVQSVEKIFAYVDGVAFIPVAGLLINRFNWSLGGWVTGYNYIRSMLSAALADDDVKGIVFDVNSGGGQVAGCFELVDDIYASRQIKPSVAIIDSSCYSAAYAIASAASKMIITPSGGAGSIGVLQTHFDYSKNMSDAGVKITFVHSGDHKIDGNPYQSLPRKVLDNMQKSVDDVRKIFVDTVARNRSIESQAVFDTQAQCYSASESLALGLVDEIKAPTEALFSFFTELQSSNLMKELPMSTAKQADAGVITEKTTTQVDAPVTTPNAVTNEAATTPKEATDPRAEERARIGGITSCAEATDKQKLANHLALNTDLSVDAAKAILATAAVETTAKAVEPTNAFVNAMVNTDNPNVGADTNGGTITRAQEIINAQKVATGNT